MSEFSCSRLAAALAIQNCCKSSMADVGDVAVDFDVAVDVEAAVPLPPILKKLLFFVARRRSELCFVVCSIE
jgi:hypothetical protein